MSEKHTWFKLRMGYAYTLSTYYFVLIVFSAGQLVIVLDGGVKGLFETHLSSLMLGTISASVSGASIYYFRKLYKACINFDFVSPEKKEDYIREFGVLLYFFLRPIFSFVFAVMMIALFKSGLSYLAHSDIREDRLLYVITIVSFFIGYSSGDILDHLETTGSKLVNKALNT